LPKQCRYLIRQPHPFWDRREAIKNEKKLRKRLEELDIPQELFENMKIDIEDL